MINDVVNTIDGIQAQINTLFININISSGYIHTYKNYQLYERRNTKAYLIRDGTIEMFITVGCKQDTTNNIFTFTITRLIKKICLPTDNCLIRSVKPSYNKILFEETHPYTSDMELRAKLDVMASHQYTIQDFVV